MLTNRKIAFFIDVDNLAIGYDEYSNALAQLNNMGEVLYGKVYGASDRKHKNICDDTLVKGFDMCAPMRIKKRGAKVFDNRIIVDVMECVLQNNSYDTVAILAAPADLIWLYSKLRSYDVTIIALDNNDEENTSFVSQLLDIGIVEHLKPIKAPRTPVKAVKAEQPKPTAKAEQPKPAAKPSKAKPVAPLMDTINKILSEHEPDQAIQEQPQQAEVIEEPIVQQPEVASQVAEPIKEQPKEEVIEQPEQAARPRRKTADELQIMKEIEDIQSTSRSVDDESAELLERIRKLIDGYRED